MKAYRVCKVLSVPSRASGATALKRNITKSDRTLTVVEGDGGIQYASLPQPSGWNGLTRLVAIFKAGSRYETSPKLHGITHLIRRSCGLSTTNYTAVNLVRHIQQMGAQLQCHTTREHIIYSVDVAPNLAPRAGYILATMATRTAFYEWELKDQAHKLMRKDIDIFNRRQFDALTLDLLHDAAFGQHPDGTGLGNSLYADVNRIGTHSIDDIEAFLSQRFTPANVAFIVTGSGPGVNGLELCESMHEAARLRPNSDVPKSSYGPKYGFIGGERRREMTGAPETYAALAWPTSGGRMADCETSLALSVIAAALAPPVQSVAYGSKASLLLPSGAALATPIHFTYSDHGLFGCMISGVDGKSVGEQVVVARNSIGEIASKGLSEEQFEQAKSRLKTEVFMRAENQVSLTTDIAVQLLDHGGDCEDNESVFRNAEDICRAVDQLQLADVNQVFEETVTGPTMALSCVGTDIAYVPPLASLTAA
ncbi:unnamed protein product [Mesocestoides corti]|uniref:Peptidase_M16 domain-containing protein n=1 Tax=Mesocestoides corti TaxID=53468 RepID=A0A0R3U1Y1_MESCO|nr:unnamed protein product [Mesocestoides corti]